MRFADAGLTTYEAYLAFAALGSVPQCQQLLQFLIATDEPRNPLGPLRLKAALDRSPPGDNASVHRIRSFGKLMRRKILANENAAEELASALGDEHRVRRCQPAQFCSYVSGCPQYGLLRTHQSQAGRHADPHLQR